MNNENLPAVVTVESLKESHGADAERLYHQIADLGGFGDFSRGDFMTGHPPLDLNGLKNQDTRSAIAKLLTKTPTIPANKIPAIVPANENKEGNQ